MKEKGGRINWLIRHMMLITGLVLAVLLLIRGAAVSYTHLTLPTILLV